MHRAEQGKPRFELGGWVSDLTFDPPLHAALLLALVGVSCFAALLLWLLLALLLFR